MGKRKNKFKREDMKNKKLLYGLIAGSLVLFGLGWYSLYLSFYVNSYDGLSFPIILFLFAFIVFYFLVVIEDDRNILYIVISFGMLGAVFLGEGHWAISFLIWLAASISCVLAINRIKIEQCSRIKINVYRVLKRGIPIIGTAFCLLVAVGFYFSVANLQSLGSIPSFNINIPIQVTKNVFKIMDAIIPNEEITWIIEGVTVDEYFQRILRSQDISLEGVVLQEIQKEADEDVKKQMESGIEREIWEKERVIINQNRQALAEKLGIEIVGNERIDEILHNLINKRANELINGEFIVSGALPFSGALALFVTVRSIVWISNMILFWTVSLIFSILVKLGKIKILTEKKNVEIIEI